MFNTHEDVFVSSFALWHWSCKTVQCSDRERRGVPPARFIEMYLAAAADDEARHNPETVREALDSSHRERWQAGLNSEMESLRENGVH